MQICTKIGEELVCSCREGFKLAEDELSCSKSMFCVC